MNLIPLVELSRKLGLNSSTLKIAFFQGTFPFKPTTIPGVRSLFVTKKQAKLIEEWQTAKKTDKNARFFGKWYETYKTKTAR